MLTESCDLFATSATHRPNLSVKHHHSQSPSLELHAADWLPFGRALQVEALN
jgi:hypothetical protein